MNIIKTQRLIIRNTKIEDIEDLYKQVFSNDEVVKYTFGKELSNFDDVKDFVEKNCNFDKKLGLSTLVEKDSSKVIGLAGVIECNYLDSVDYEFGFILGSDFWGKGYASEIGQAQIDYVKNEIKAKRVLALAHKENEASVKCINKLGLEYKTTISTENRGDREVFSLDFY